MGKGMPTQSNEEYQIGLTMSGAISAGAYTAGVFDFLIQALDEWENAREGKSPGVNPEDIPNHRVGLKVMSGASAGAITAAIGAVALADADQTPVPFMPLPAADKQKIKYYLPKLYETWVVRPSLIAAQGQKTDFLTNDDLGGPPRPAEDDFTRTVSIPSGDPLLVTSVLNSQLLDEIAKAGVAVANVRQTPRAYVAERLHVYMTLSNLRGVPYKISFSGGDYHMISHGDRVHYSVTGLGVWHSPSAFADNDKPRPIAAAQLVGNAEGKRIWQDYGVCALGSAAFPVGLAPREIGATLGTNPTRNEYQDRSFPIDALVGKKIDPDFTAKVGDEIPTYWFTTADGGIIDNDPFEYARFSIKEDPSAPNKTGLKEADRAVIMVSPFPELKPIKPQGDPKLGILSIFSTLMPALIDQARFKPSELVLAADPEVASRYLIGPSRLMRVGDPKSDARYPIASGLLGGFGGFVAQAFRDYDYQLGRRNCQRFLRHIFTVPPGHAIFESWPQAAKNNPAFKADPTEKMPVGYCIVPLFWTAAPEVVQPDWPRISQTYLDNLQKRIVERLDYIARPLLNQNVKDMLLRSLLQTAWTAAGREKAIAFVSRTILSDLVRRNQIEVWDLPPAPGLQDEDIRQVLAALINPASDQYSVKELEKATELSEATIRAALAFCQAAAAKGTNFEVWTTPWKKDEKETYALVKFSSWTNWIKGQVALGAERIGAWFAKPNADVSGG
jgi:hypothetical protein